MTDNGKIFCGNYFKKIDMKLITLECNLFLVVSWSTIVDCYSAIFLFPYKYYHGRKEQKKIYRLDNTLKRLCFSNKIDEV